MALRWQGNGRSKTIANSADPGESHQNTDQLTDSRGTSTLQTANKHVAVRSSAVTPIAVKNRRPIPRWKAITHLKDAGQMQARERTRNKQTHKGTEAGHKAKEQTRVGSDTNSVAEAWRQKAEELQGIREEWETLEKVGYEWSKDLRLPRMSRGEVCRRVVISDRWCRLMMVRYKLQVSHDGTRRATLK